MSDTIIFGGGIVENERGAVPYTILKYLLASRQVPRLNDLFDDEEFEHARMWGWWDFSDLTLDDWMMVTRLIEKLESECPAAIPDWREEARPFFISRLAPFCERIAKRMDHIRAGEPRKPIEIPSGPIILVNDEYPPLSDWIKIQPTRDLDAAPVLNALAPYVGRPSKWPKEILTQALRLQDCDHIVGRWEAEELVTEFARYPYRDATAHWAMVLAKSGKWTDDECLAVSNGLFRLGEAVTAAPGDMLQLQPKLEAQKSLWYSAMEIRAGLAGRGFYSVEPIDWKRAQWQMLLSIEEKQGQAGDLLRAHGLKRPKPKRVR